MCMFSPCPLKAAWKILICRSPDGLWKKAFCLKFISAHPSFSPLEEGKEKEGGRGGAGEEAWACVLCVS